MEVTAALTAAILAYAAPLHGAAPRIYDCHQHPQSITCRVKVHDAPSTDYGLTVNGRTVPVTIDFGCRARRRPDGTWQIVGPYRWGYAK